MRPRRSRIGPPFRGHTEYLAALTGSVLPVMMLCAPGLRVALCTTHVPLREVSGLITETHVTRVLRVLVRDLRERFGVPAPRVDFSRLAPLSVEIHPSAGLPNLFSLAEGAESLQKNFTVSARVRTRVQVVFHTILVKNSLA